MKEIVIYLGVFFGIAVILAIRAYYTGKQSREFLRRKIKKNWGNIPERVYEAKEFDNISHYYKNNKQNGYFVDDITWNDLNMDAIFMQMNNTYSSVGEEYLYNMLRRPNLDNASLEKNEKIVSYFEKNESVAFKLQELFHDLGRTHSISFYDFLFRLKDLGKRSNYRHYLQIALIFVSVALTVIVPPVGILCAVAALGFNVITYFSDKSKIESYFTCFKYLVSMIVISQKLNQTQKDSELSSILNDIKTYSDELKSIRKGSFLITGNNMSGSLEDIIMDYVRMIFHVDLIKFNSMLNSAISKTDTIDSLFAALGRLESCIAIASFRKQIPYYCKPVFLQNEKSTMTFEEIYHPSIEHAIANDLDEHKCVLITGSNASGKSTFLKTVAINAILAQAINTCTANEYSANYFEIYSSMALRDDLQSNESYYIVEIKSLKRIIDKVGQKNHILCFVDEVLRGTNTIERIAASAHILKNLSQNNVLCFAATHDIELTHILEDYYSNYHFQEEVEDNDIIFNYKLYSGEATSRNAIKLLGIIGYNNDIINAAEKTAADFVKNGNWTKCY